MFSMFFIDLGDLKYEPFWIYTFHNMINVIIWNVFNKIIET